MTAIELGRKIDVITQGNVPEDFNALLDRPLLRDESPVLRCELAFKYLRTYERKNLYTRSIGGEPTGKEVCRTC